MIVASATLTGECPEMEKWLELCVETNQAWIYLNHPNIGVIGAYQNIYRGVRHDAPSGFLAELWAQGFQKHSTSETLICYLHSDVEIYEKGWDRRVRLAFEDPQVGIVGFGGATRHGRPDLYRVPYKITDLAREDYVSNTKDAEVHGRRFEGECDVAVLDGFALIVRRELLDKCGGWQPDRWPPHHIYDYRICAEARRHGYRIRMVGVACHHRGGETAVSKEYQDWCATTKWGSDAAMHAEGHRMFYEEYRDVMPWRIK